MLSRPIDFLGQATAASSDFQLTNSFEQRTFSDDWTLVKRFLEKLELTLHFTLKTVITDITRCQNSPSIGWKNAPSRDPLILAVYKKNQSSRRLKDLVEALLEFHREPCASRDPSINWMVGKWESHLVECLYQQFPNDCHTCRAWIYVRVCFIRFTQMHLARSDDEEEEPPASTTKIQVSPRDNSGDRSISLKWFNEGM